MKNGEKTVVALGYFDSVHIGHRKVLKKAKELALSLGANFTVFTFLGNLRGEFNSKDYSLYSDEKRREIYENLGADKVCFAPATKEFLKMSGDEFLNWVNQRVNVVAYVCGRDYKYGKNASCDVAHLKKYANKLGQRIEVCDIVEENGKKVSTTLIKSLLNKGEIREANRLLCEDFNVKGKVVKGRGQGKELGFPTANIDVYDLDSKLKCGVYSGSAQVDGKNYKCLINFGTCPTFNQNCATLEVHIIGYCGDLYGKELNISFERFLRDISKFNGKAELIKQITEDKERVINGK